jgi:hypothetical protein
MDSIIIVAQLEYDGDSESVIDRGTERRITGDKIYETTEVSLQKGELCDPPMTFSTLLVETPSPTKTNEIRCCSDNNSSRASISAAITVSKLQATFAEKTAADMEQIVNWYKRYGDDERFVKVNQSDSLPENSIVYDSLHSRYPAGTNTNDPSNTSSDESDFLLESSPSQSFSSDSSWVTPTSSPTASTIYGISGGAYTSSSSNITPVRSNRIGSSLSSSSSLSPTICSEEVRRQLETVDHLVRITQYMAEVVVDLEQTTSSSSRETETTISTSRYINNLQDIGPDDKPDRKSHMEGPIKGLTRNNCVIDPPEIVRTTRFNNPSCTRTRGASKSHRHSYPMVKMIVVWIIVPLILSTLMFIFFRKQDLTSIVLDADGTAKPTTNIIQTDVLEPMVPIAI